LDDILREQPLTPKESKEFMECLEIGGLHGGEARVNKIGQFLMNRGVSGEEFANIIGGMVKGKKNLGWTYK
jgi:hypothetical protein